MNYKKFAGTNSKYLGIQDFDSMSEIKTVTIKQCVREQVQNEFGTETKGVLYFEEDVKPWIFGSKKGKPIVKLYGIDTDNWIGKKISLYCDPKVKMKGELCGGVRVKPSVITPSATHIKCENCGKNIGYFGGMTAEQMADYTKSKYGKSLCADCATSAAKSREESNNENNEN